MSQASVTEIQFASNAGIGIPYKDSENLWTQGRVTKMASRVMPTKPVVTKEEVALIQAWRNGEIVDARTLAPWRMPLPLPEMIVPGKIDDSACPDASLRGLVLRHSGKVYVWDTDLMNHTQFGDTLGYPDILSGACYGDTDGWGFYAFIDTDGNVDFQQYRVPDELVSDTLTTLEIMAAADSHFLARDPYVDPYDTDVYWH